ncbi:10902_t:CDS:2 [Acaulospora colombiana]|uniref:10902_t:CDS:1 n=1 Tax=Acaulospora colombiana TaxID=27376 RepID=A0ACA9MM52_9GLOM|nr:10902_t:CDS:2 [Acaulospora colombiana]
MFEEPSEKIDRDFLYLPLIRKERPNFQVLCSVLKKLEHIFLDKETKPVWESYSLDRFEESSPVNQKDAIEWLTKLVASPLDWIYDDFQKEEIMDRAAKSSGPIIREWCFPPPTGSHNSIVLKIRDSTLLDDNVGFKTWGAAYLLAKRFTSGESITREKLVSNSILEIGAGTGLVGLTCAKMGCSNVLLTDYHPHVLTNIDHNIKINQLSVAVSMEKLDWKEIASGNFENLPSYLLHQKFDIILGADIVYEIPHTDWIPEVIIKFMKTDGIFYLEIPLRTTHAKEVELFERNMIERGLILKKVQNQKGLDDFNGIQNYRYYEWVYRP